MKEIERVSLYVCVCVCKVLCKGNPEFNKSLLSDILSLGVCGLGGGVCVCISCSFSIH